MYEHVTILLSVVVLLWPMYYDRDACNKMPYKHLASDKSMLHPK
jgi:RsiW-degrading membrane proteinase PrsW (M82 family)